MAHKLMKCLKILPDILFNLKNKNPVINNLPDFADINCFTPAIIKNS